MRKDKRLRALDNQIGRLQRRLEWMERASYRFSWIRIGTFIAALVAAGTAYHFVGLGLLSISAVAAGALFGVLVDYHRQVDRSIARHEVWLEIKQTQITRARLDWERIPPTFRHRPQDGHPFEADLDLIGPRSLCRLVDTAVSYEGSQRLRALLTISIPEPRESTRRQQLVRELGPRWLFRDKLRLNGTLAAGTTRTWEANQLARWLERHAPEGAVPVWLLLSSALAGLNAILFVISSWGLLPPWWQVTFVLYLGLVLAKSKSLGALWEEALALEGALRQLGAVFRQLETFSYGNAPNLRVLCEPFLDRARQPSRYLARITRVVAAMGVRGNPFVWFALNAVVPWDFYFAYRLDQHKEELAKHIPKWMDVWFELEALGSLANFVYLNPGYSFPEILTGKREEEAFVFRARALGHPLIPDDDRVCNDFTVSELGQVTIVTGSNMSGKSVFLKTLGVNLALANAGGPVSAQYLKMLPFRMFTSIGVTDSVVDGISYFYAEVKRLRRLLVELERDHVLPLLFCIDEIFRGTNNRERLIGSQAFVAALARRNGIGFIATHDLELAKLAERISGVANFHFRDYLAEGRMVFDYTLRPGPCPTTNALKIMELEGLPVEATNDM